jgi:hypothetical protein
MNAREMHINRHRLFLLLLLFLRLHLLLSLPLRPSVTIAPSKRLQLSIIRFYTVHAFLKVKLSSLRALPVPHRIVPFLAVIG